MEIAIRPARPEQAEDISALITGVFDAFVAPDCEAGGRETFAREAEPVALAARLSGDSRGFVAGEAGRLVGYIEMRGHHVSELFVVAERQRRGLARQLLDRALAGLEGAEITVNSSPYAEAIYARLGFRPAGGWVVKEGLRFRPMTLKV